MRFSHLDHAPDAVWKHPIVGLHHLAVLAIWRDASERKVVILYLGEKGFGTKDADFIRVTGCVAFRDFSRSVSAAVVHKNIFPILMCLAQDAFDALTEVVACVKERRYDTY